MDSLLQSCNGGKLFCKAPLGGRCFAARILRKIYPLQQLFDGLALRCTMDECNFICIRLFLAKEGRIYLIQLRGHHRNCPSSGYLHCRRCQECICVHAHISQAWGDMSREVSKAIVVCSGDGHAVSHHSYAVWPGMQSLFIATGVQAPQSIGTCLSPTRAS